MVSSVLPDVRTVWHERTSSITWISQNTASQDNAFKMLRKNSQKGFEGYYYLKKNIFFHSFFLRPTCSEREAGTPPCRVALPAWQLQHKETQTGTVHPSPLPRHFTQGVFCHPTNSPQSEHTNISDDIGIILPITTFGQHLALCAIRTSVTAASVYCSLLLGNSNAKHYYASCIYWKRKQDFTICI